VSRLSPQDEALRAPLRAVIKPVADRPADRRARSWQGFDATFSRALAKAGYLGLTLPRRYGGGERGPLARFVVIEELLCAGAPVAAHWIADRQSAPLILNYGTDAQRERYLPLICAGDVFFCIGMSEPGSGSDLASVRTRAERTARGWLLNGQKTWTTHAMHSDYMIALVRTSGSAADRHVGLSQLIVDLHAPGVTIRRITDLTGDAHFAEVFFENVELAADALIGTEGDGWRQVNAELAFERSGPERIYSSVVLLDAWIEHVQRAGRFDGATAELAGRLTAPGQLCSAANGSTPAPGRASISCANGSLPHARASMSSASGSKATRSEDSGKGTFRNPSPRAPPPWRRIFRQDVSVRRFTV
jgi:alkylation response protein AidB-like acyl-CoA dehydrogenase